MVHFNEQERSFTITFKGSATDYFNKLRAISRLMAIANTDMLDAETVYYGNTLLEEMMPDPEQSIDVINK